MRTSLIVVPILLLIGVVPFWSCSSGWGYYRAGAIGLELLKRINWNTQAAHAWKV